jgi:hypothetical protein
MTWCNALLFAQAQDDGAGVGGAAMLLIQLAVAVAAIAGLWKCFTKAGKPGWAAIIPIYNLIVILEIAGKPIWWVLLLFIPCVNIVIILLVLIDFAKAYGQGAGFAIGLWLLGFIFFPILGFGDARYIGPPK